MTPTRYRKRPVEIEAVVLTAENVHDVAEWCGGKQSRYRDFDTTSYILAIPTLEGVMAACIGDYIIRGVAGEFYPCKPDIFKKTYEEV